MAEKSNIEWTDSTVNFWWGCTKVGPGCDWCYAETWSKRTGEDIWGVGVPRRKIKGAVALLYKLNNSHASWASDYAIEGLHATLRRRVFIQSMSDLFDLEVPVEWFEEAWQAIGQCNQLNIQIVTKRISAVEKRLAAIGATAWPKHAGLLITVCNQDEADRDIPRLLALKAKLGIPWVGLSVEPLLGPIDLQRYIERCHAGRDGDCEAASCPQRRDGEPMRSGRHCPIDTWPDREEDLSPLLDWIIVGGESGSKARPMHPDWARSLRDQCAAAGVPFFFQQWGEWHAAAELMADGSFNLLRKGERAGEFHSWGEDGWSVRVGKKRAGRFLGGIEHNGMPKAFGGRDA